MIPSNTLSSQVLSSQFLYPDNIVLTQLQDMEYGGIAIQDTSKGSQYQVWFGEWDATTGNVVLKSEKTGQSVVLFTEQNVLEFSFAFDQNMNWSTVTRLSDGTTKHRWYDGTVNSYVVNSYSNITSCKLALDDKRTVQALLGTTDVIFTYLTSDRKLCYRQQRDRFTIERVLATNVPPKAKIINFGMNSRLRLQWKLQIRSGEL